MEKEYYIHIQWWMAQRLKLSGNELLTYAIVYGFSQDGESAFLGSSKYVSYALRVSRPTAIKALDSLTSKGLIIKTQEKINDVVFNRYKANLQVIKDFDRPYKESLQGGYKETLHSNKYKELNNKELNKESKKEESNNTQNEQVENCTSGNEETNALKEKIKCLEKEIEVLKDNKKERKPKKQTKSYDEQIAEYTCNEELQNALKAFVQMRSFIKKPMTEYALKLMLNKLDELGNNDTTKIAILNQSIKYNWQGIFPLKNEYTKQEKQPEKKYDQNGYESEEELMKMFYGK